MKHLWPWPLLWLALPVGCAGKHWRERPEFVNRDPLPIQRADDACLGALISVDDVSLESPLNGSRHTDDARRALEVALNEAGYSLAYQSDAASHMKVVYTAKYKDYARDNWADQCCTQMWSLCATAHLARKGLTLEDLTVCDDNVDVRDLSDLAMERIAALLVAALNQDESAKAILKNDPSAMPESLPADEAID